MICSDCEVSHTERACFLCSGAKGLARAEYVMCYGTKSVWTYGDKYGHGMFNLEIDGLPLPKEVYNDGGYKLTAGDGA
jgi:tRNA(Arg) A34 adenosine deaminase TadA